MAEAVVFNLATDILRLASSVTGSKIQLVCGARDELDSLKDAVENIRNVLLDAEKQRWHNNQVKDWLRKLKDVLYDIEDLLDDVATEDLRRKVTPGNKMSIAVRIFFSKSNQPAHRLKVANKIQELRKRLDQIENAGKFNLKVHQREETMAIGRGKKTLTFAPDRAIIGREEDQKKIKRLLFDSSSRPSVSFVAIVGIGGLGKTALARLVYNDGEVEEHFELKMWVCVSDVFDVNLITKEILKSANCQDLESKPIDQLQSLLHETLGGKKYLLVLDDMWNEDRNEWLQLGYWLEGGFPGSKVLVTTRSHTVAKVTDANSAIHDLKGLDSDKSWDLFREMAFGDRQALVERELEDMGGVMVGKCAGVPLAIRTIGSLLYGKDKGQWKIYRMKELPDIQEINADYKGIMQVLKFSYDHLPLCLKHCFAYFSLFPKDHIYNKDDMIHLWMAQGFIETPNREENLEEVAENYLSELQCRSFLDAEMKSDNGQVIALKMHDLMHDLAQKVAGDECKIVNFEGQDNDGRIVNFKGRDNDRGIRHASFISDIFSKEKMTSLLKASKLRTFLYLKNESSILNCHKVFSRCIHSRVLRLGNTDIPLPPSSFRKLKHLRFLEICGNLSIQSLPDSIADLVNLQTLKLFGCEKLKSFPRDLRKLVNLKYLSVVGCSSLSHLPPLSELPSLRTLTLWHLDAVEFLEQTSEPEQSNTTSPFFPSLERLSLFFCQNLKGWWERRQVIGAHQKHRSDNSRSVFPKLRSVQIGVCPHLSVVTPFPQVEELGIDSTRMLEQQLMAHPNCPSEAAVGTTVTPFSKLKHLFIVGRTDTEPWMLETLLRLASNLEAMRLHSYDLRSLTRGMQHLSSLQELHIEYCEGLDFSCREDKHGTQWQFLKKLRCLEIKSLMELEALPEGIQHITTLQSLEISDCPKLRRLPKWIENLSLLKKLVLFNCPNLTHLPFEMCKLTHLKELRILHCSALKERCSMDEGEDWIEHMPVIVGDYESSY